MKTYIKKILAASLLALALIAFTTPVQADVGTVDFGITNSIAAALTNGTAAQCGTAVNIDNVDNIGVVFSGYGSAAGTSNVKITFALSGDGTTYATNTGTFDWYIPAVASGIRFTAYTNIPNTVVGSAGYIQVYQLGNANTTANITNASLTVIKKKLR